MEQYHRLEDALPDWRARARRIAAAEAGAVSPARDLGTEQGQFAADPDKLPVHRIASACLAWMTGHGCWPNQAADRQRVVNEVAAALRDLITPIPETGSDGDVPGSAWAVPAAAGSGLGALLLSPLTFLWFDNRLIGLFAGGALGAFLAVKGVSALLERPRLVSVVRSAAVLSAGGMVTRGIWGAIRGESLGWVRSVLWLLATPLLMSVLQPRRAAPGANPAGDGPARRSAELAQAADLALAVSWCHPDRLVMPEDKRPAEPGDLPGPVLVALSQLQSELTRGASDRDVRESCEDLLQRLEEGGFEWRSVSPGTPYDQEMAALFDVFGTIPPRQAVRTQRAAITRRGQVVNRGELRRA